MITIRGTVDPTTYRGAVRPARLHVPGGPAPASVLIDKPQPLTTFTDTVRSAGAIGAVAGSVAGRGAMAAVAAAAGATVAKMALQALPAPVGAGVWAVAGVSAGLAAGLAAGTLIEAKVKAGRVLGGLVGAAAGLAAGVAVATCGWRAAPALARATNGFSLTALPPKLANPSYVGTPSLRHDANAKPALRAALPGDIIVSHHENHFASAAWLSKLAGARADYTHAGLVTEQGTVIDMVATGARELPIDSWLRFTHLAVLRPRYASVTSLMGTVTEARAAISTRTYDDDLRLDNDPSKEYCTEFIYRRLQENAPEVRLTEQRVMGWSFVTPDVFIDSPQIDTMYDSGSHFWRNLLARVC